MAALQASRTSQAQGPQPLNTPFKLPEKAGPAAAVGGQESVRLFGEVYCAPTMVLAGGILAGEHTFTVGPGQSSMTITLTYDEDPVGAGFNDLDLIITSPSGGETTAAAAGPEPPVTIPSPAAGDWTITVDGYSCGAAQHYGILVTFVGGLVEAINYCNVEPVAAIEVPDTLSILYISDYGGGTWTFRESNGVPGLQVGNTHPGGEVAEAAGSYSGDWVGCENGDMMMM